ncbi:MAG: hypothetical protein I3J03_01520 [Actinomyces succiniciruminis]|nr:hypothetical protein [Actinomyces succiniciruminis]
MALSIPAEVDEDEMISSFQWAYANSGLEVPVNWDKDSQTLTLMGVSATAGAPLPIVAVKESD